ncbi:MAG: DoxX family protein [Opitutaceae bacterium]|jgi:putative oxidoreductase|nr:DoxX family protein [Opitutaceae bacterium]
MTPSSVPSSRPGLLWLDRLARVVVAAILVQTLYFKFTGAPESIYIFTTVGQEPWGRYGSGVVEALASVLLFVPGTVAIGAALALGTMSGAIFFHLTRLGIEVQGDGGLLFSLAVVVWICSAALLWRHRRSLPVVGSRL